MYAQEEFPPPDQMIMIGESGAERNGNEGGGITVSAESQSIGSLSNSIL